MPRAGNGRVSLARWERMKQNPPRRLTAQLGMPFPFPHLYFLICTMGVRLEGDIPGLDHTDCSVTQVRRNAVPT